MKTYVRRCQGWESGLYRPYQCKRPAVDGTRCEKHQHQKAEEWMEKS